MKKIIALAISALLISLLLASCAGASSTQAYDGAKPHMAASSSAPGGNALGYSAAKDAGAPPLQGSSNSASGKAEAKPAGDLTSVDPNSALTSGTIAPSINGDKIIYNYNATIETKKFDETLKNLTMLLSKYSAFVETSYVSGNSYGNTTYRSADYTIRVPVENFKGMTDSLSTLGNVTSGKTTSQNITAQFIDTQSRLNAYKTEESRLLAMLDKASTVTDMITIENRLSDVRYQIESLTSTLQNWQNQVSFSTVTFHISEVAELTDVKPIQRSYWEKMLDGIQSTLRGVGDFFKDFFLVIVVALPVLVVLAVIAVVIIVLVRRSNKKKRAKMSQMQAPQYPQNPPYQQPPQYPQNPPNQNGDKKE